MRRIIPCLFTALAVLAFPLAALTQPAGKLHRIGFLSAGSEKAFRQRMAAFRNAMDDLGYREGRNLVIEERYAAGRRKRLPALATELVGLGVDLLLTNGGTATKQAAAAAARAGRSIPVVFALAPDPVGAGLVASLARPGGSVTGLSNANNILVRKRLALLIEIVPSARRIAVLYSARARSGPNQLHILEAVAPEFGVTLVPVAFDRPEAFDRAMAALREARADALNVLGSSLTNGFSRQIAARAAKLGLAAMFSSARGADAGGLISYGTDPTENYARAAIYVHKIFSGAKPADLPVELPTRFRLTLNLKTAKALGIVVPRVLLLRAETVIE